MTGQPEIKSLVDTDKNTQLFYQMKLIRRFEEKSAELYTKEKIRGFLHLYVGEEAVAVGVMQSLTTEDNVLSTYREHGHALARGIDAGTIMAEMYGKLEGCSRGRGGSMHLFDAKKKFYVQCPLSLGEAKSYSDFMVDTPKCLFAPEMLSRTLAIINTWQVINR